MQSHKFLHHYLPASKWAVLQSLDTLSNKMTVMASFMIESLGIRHADQATKKLAVVICTMASGLEPESTGGKSALDLSG